MKTAASLRGGEVLTPQGAIVRADVHIAEGRIVEAPAADAASIDCNGYCVLPGIVDLHGDAFEQELHPRPGVDIDPAIALASVDRQLLANGITTGFHGLTISWEPGARSLEAGRRFMAALAELRPRLVADHRVQLRWETFAHEAIEDLAAWLAEDPIPAIAFNDHTTLTLERLRRGDTGKFLTWAQRAGLSLEGYLARAAAVGERAAEVPAKIREVAALARQRGAAQLAHDEDRLEQRELHRGLGMAISEFPFTAEVAGDAVTRHEHVVMGGPNVIRGGSQNGNLSAEEAVRDGLCTVLASDYYYPSLLHAAERLVRRGVSSLAEAWNLVSANPAAALGLDDRGTLEIGRRADIVVVDCRGPWRLVHAIAGGIVVSFGR